MHTRGGQRLIPTYIYDCPRGHTFESTEGYDVEKKFCPAMIPWGLKDSLDPDDWIECGKKATRRSVYREQGVIFKGPDFTKSVIASPPPIPDHVSTPDEHLENLDSFARASHDYDKNTRPYLREEAGLEPRE